jgi:thimet oligopeptidase
MRRNVSRSCLLFIATSALGLEACSGAASRPEPVAPTPVAAAEPEAPDAPAPTPKPMTRDAQFAAACRAGLVESRAQLAKILAVEGERTLANTLEPFADLSMHLENSWALASLTSAVHPDEALREEARKCEQEVRVFDSEVRLHRGLYDALAALDTSGYDVATARLVDLQLKGFRRSGVDRDEATRARLKQIDDTLTTVGQKFDQNIAEDESFIEVDGVEDLAGLPADWIAAHPVGENGKIRISTNTPDYLPIQTYADAAEVRRRLYIARKMRAAPANDALLKELLTLRAEKARLLGFANWADYITEDKMMKSGTNAAEFIDRVVRLSAKRSKADYAMLLRRKRKDDPRAKRVEDDEKVYYQNKIMAEDYQVDAQEVRAYFEYEIVEKGLLAITADMYGIEYVRVDDAEVWHESVKTFDVMQGGKKLGRIFLDMHPRAGKYKHFAQFTILSGVAGKQLPEGALVCNFPDPRTSGGPALMEHHDVETMFHEFGHLMHHVFGGQQHWAPYSGVATERDFVEAPSQMFEEWAWSYETLKLFARHHETGVVIPEDLVRRMQRSRSLMRGVEVRQQMFYAAVSLRFHQLDPATLDLDQEVRRLQASVTPFAYVEGTAMHANFGHLEGYSAMYYTYMWSQVLARDLLSPFAKHGLLNKEWTYRYRDRILAPGGSKDAADLVRDFLGRDYSYTAFEQWLKQ